MKSREGSESVDLRAREREPGAPPPGSVRLFELLAVLSLATDLGMGRPTEHELRVCLLAGRLAARLDLDNDAQREVLTVALIRWIGCTAHSYELGQVFGDEIAAYARSDLLDFTSARQVILDVTRHAGAGRPLLSRMATVWATLTHGPDLVQGSFEASCEVGRALAERLRLPATVQHAVGHGFERWDGRGWPNHLRGEEIAFTMRVVQVAQLAAAYFRAGGRDLAVQAVLDQAGRGLDPALAREFATAANDLLPELERPSSWAAVLAAEPQPAVWYADETLDEALTAMGEFADLKSPYTAGHSTRVAALAAAAAEQLGMPSVDVRAVRRAGLVHDLGRTGVPSNVWDRAGALPESDLERVWLHPYFTERMLARSEALHALGVLAASHHERLDGSGYHRGTRGDRLSPLARVLAAADTYATKTEPRPHRAAHSTREAAEVLRMEARAGRLDGHSVEAVLQAAGQRHRRRTQQWPAGLTIREVEVLRHLVLGRPNREIAHALTISERTVAHHVQHIYSKLGVSSRAAAALFAARNGLLDDA